MFAYVVLLISKNNQNRNRFHFLPQEMFPFFPPIGWYPITMHIPAYQRFLSTEEEEEEEEEVHVELGFR